MQVQSNQDKSEIRAQMVSSSTLLIPGHLLKYYRFRVNCFSGTGHYFEHLLATYGRQLARYSINPVTTQWKKKYQNKGLDLQIRNFKPNPELWEEFRHIAFAYGLAMCHLFVVLLELELKRWRAAGSPSVFFEKSSTPSQTNRKNVNSLHENPNLQAKEVIKLLYHKKSTVLIRSIDFSRSKLHRICLVN
ncbi:MAG: DUF1564 family protein [Leptospiraceae bacterium]|nr:DUF1564 family protein [Leptospiraceae bacterium]